MILTLLSLVSLNISWATIGYGLFTAAVGFGVWMLQRWWVQRKEKEKTNKQATVDETAELKRVVAQLVTDMAIVQVQAVPINAAYQAMLIAKLTHFHTPVMDALMEKLGPPSTLTPEEREQLSDAVLHRMNDISPNIDEEERLAAKILIDVAQLARIEADRAASHEGGPELQLLLVAQPIRQENKPDAVGR